ncbi:hypothetical protein BO88DRAFT_479036, partial [Aspergillus vadensis CBS 113365]
VKTSTYDHRVWKTGLPVRSAVLKPHAGRLVVGWVTTSESLLLYVFVLYFSPPLLGKTQQITSSIKQMKPYVHLVERHGVTSRTPLKSWISPPANPRYTYGPRYVNAGSG